MALTSGTKLGPYEIQSPLGAGGMGEVYRARDTRLDRTVAVKILPSHLSDSPEAKQRFEREARAISSLNHPNICTLHDVGHQDGIDYLVMEYLEGETLADRLAKGALSPEQVLKYAIEICEGLERAHKNGVVHRDLKPGNVMLTKTGAKLMDFGLAKAATQEKPPSSGLTATLMSPGGSHPLTAQGTVVGTFQYMSPEQVEGNDADARSDIFALGAVLYEMATGKRAFAGKTTASVVAAILASEPQPISSIRPMSPPALEHLVSTCLVKDPEARWQCVSDVASQLRWISQSSAQAAAAPRARRKLVPVLAAGMALLFAAIAGVAYWRLRTSSPGNFEFYVPAPEKATLNTMGVAGAPTVSPDGKQIAFLATTAEGVKSLWVRPLDSAEPRPLPETENASYPFWSPDGRSVAFFADEKLKKVTVNGGVPSAICDVTEGRGGSWSEQGFIIFGMRDGGLYKVSASGGRPAPITRLDKSKLEGSHRFPLLLPDGDHYLFVVQAPHVFLASGSLKAGHRLADIPEIDSSASYSQGNLLFVRGTTLLAQPFDPARLQFTGDPISVAEKVRADPQFNFGAFSVSSNGVLVYEGGASGLSTQLLWLDRTGKQLGSLPGIGSYFGVSLSPSGNQLLVEVDEASAGKGAVWLYDLIAATHTRLTFNDISSDPSWSHDGRRIAFDVGQTAELHVRDLANGVETTLISMPGESAVTGWSPDDRYVVFDSHGSEINSKWETWVADTTGQHNRYPLLQPATDARYTRISPDGKWLAYAGYETGRPEIYVVPVDFSGTQPKTGGNKWQISTEGGAVPVWARDGRELFFTNAPMTTLYAASFTVTDGMVHAGTVRKLFDLSPHSNSSFYDVSPDGQKFYVAEAPQGSSSPLTVITNWLARIKR